MSNVHAKQTIMCCSIFPRRLSDLRYLRQCIFVFVQFAGKEKGGFGLAGARRTPGRLVGQVLSIAVVLPACLRLFAHCTVRIGTPVSHADGRIVGVAALPQRPQCLGKASRAACQDIAGRFSSTTGMAVAFRPATSLPPCPNECLLITFVEKLEALNEEAKGEPLSE